MLVHLTSGMPNAKYSALNTAAAAFVLVSTRRAAATRPFAAPRLRSHKFCSADFGAHRSETIWGGRQSDTFNFVWRLSVGANDKSHNQRSEQALRAVWVRVGECVCACVF
jgi:hypothetical protein